MANTALAEVLNDLIQINNDRIEGYEKALAETDKADADLKGIFTKMISQSRENLGQLNSYVTKLGETPATGTTLSGKVYRVWMDVKSAFNSKERESALELSERGEDAAQKAYKEALASDANMSTEARQLITSQQASLKTSHDLIKKHRDMHQAVNH